MSDERLLNSHSVLSGALDLVGITKTQCMMIQFSSQWLQHLSRNGEEKRIKYSDLMKIMRETAMSLKEFEKYVI